MGAAVPSAIWGEADDRCPRLPSRSGLNKVTPFVPTQASHAHHWAHSWEYPTGLMKTGSGVAQTHSRYIWVLCFVTVGPLADHSNSLSLSALRPKWRRVHISLQGLPR